MNFQTIMILSALPKNIQLEVEYSQNEDEN